MAQSFSLLLSRSAQVVAASLAIAACGGGGGGGGGFPLAGFGGAPAPAPAPAPPPAPAPGPVTVAGKVLVLGPIGNATVCVDGNRNNACDAGEPTSGKTGADGAYSFSYTPPDATVAAELAAAPLVAQIASGTVAEGASFEAAAPDTPLATRAYSFSAPAGKPGQINPLTTLVQTGLAAGLSLEQSEAAVAIQLGVTAAQIYDYQGVPPDTVGFTDNARTMAGMTNIALNTGAVLSVVDPASVTTPTPSTQLASFNYTSPSDYYVQTYPTTGVVGADGKVRLTDARAGMTAGVATAPAALYTQVRLTPGGWERCNEASAFDSTLGLPSRSDYCSGALPSVGFTVNQDIAGRRIADVVAEIQAATDGSGTIFGFDPAATLADPNALFPAGSLLRVRTGLNLAQRYLVNNANTDNTGFATLEALIAARPASGVVLATGAGTSSLGLSDPTHLLRVAFIDAATVQYYTCDSVSPYTTFSNCVVGTTGAYRISVIDGARVIELDAASYPATSVDNRRSFGEYAGSVYMVRKVRPELVYNFSVARRLNGPAWDALKAQLGL